MGRIINGGECCAFLLLFFGVMLCNVWIRIWDLYSVMFVRVLDFFSLSNSFDLLCLARAFPLHLVN